MIHPTPKIFLGYPPMVEMTQALYPLKRIKIITSARRLSMCSPYCCFATASCIASSSLPDPASWFFPMSDELPGPGSSFTLYCKTSFPLSLLPLPKPTRAFKHSLSLSLSLSMAVSFSLANLSEQV